MASDRAHSDKCSLKLFIQGLAHVSLLESKSGFEIVTQLADTRKLPSFTSKLSKLYGVAREIP